MIRILLTIKRIQWRYATAGTNIFDVTRLDIIKKNSHCYRERAFKIENTRTIWIDQLMQNDKVYQKYRKTDNFFWQLLTIRQILFSSKFLNKKKKKNV